MHTLLLSTMLPSTSVALQFGLPRWCAEVVRKAISLLTADSSSQDQGFAVFSKLKVCAGSDLTRREHHGTMPSPATGAWPVLDVCGWV
jgi:hypothetical protein